MTYQKIPEEQYKKALFQARGQIAGIMNTFRCYGLQAEVDIAIEEIVKVVELFAMKVRGKDIPIMVIKGPKRRATD